MTSDPINWKEIAFQNMAELWLLRKAADKMAEAIQAKGWPEQLKALEEYREVRNDNGRENTVRQDKST